MKWRGTSARCSGLGHLRLVLAGLPVQGLVQQVVTMRGAAMMNLAHRCLQKVKAVAQTARGRALVARMHMVEVEAGMGLG
jgi:hypothetical protein